MEREKCPNNGVATLESIVALNSKIREARELAILGHSGQKRFNGEDYFSHPEAVARILCEELQISDPVMIEAAYLHDLPEDTDIKIDVIKAQFGEEVATLVEGMTKIRKDITENGKPLDKREVSQLTEKKVFQFNDIDPRLGILKAAGDRLHNMRTLEYVPDAKKLPKAKETLVYAKLLESLGVWKIMTDLEDMSLKYLKPNLYMKFKKEIESDPRIDNNFIEYMVSSLQSIIPLDIKTEISYQKIGATRLIHKMKSTPDVKDVNDLVSFRVVVDEDNDVKAAEKCYQILGILQRNYSECEDRDRFDNFYFKPKTNGYSAIQITLNTTYGAVEIAITSKKKEEFNVWGVVSLLRKGEKDLSKYSRVLVFTSKWDAKFFPKGATAIDFAYSIDKSLGARAIYALINGQKKEMAHVLKSGEQIVIAMGEERIVPSAPWASDNKYCLPETWEIISEQTLDLQRFDQIKMGRQIAQDIIKKVGLYDLSDLNDSASSKDDLARMLFYLGCKGSLDSLYFQLGSGRILPEKLDDQMHEFGLTKENLNLHTLVIEGEDKSGILGKIGGHIKDIGGNVEIIKQEKFKNDGKDMFKMRFVVKKLGEDNIKCLFEKIVEDGFAFNIEIC